MPEAQQHKDSPPTLYTVREVAALLRLDESTVYRMVARGTIGGVQFGPRSTVRIPSRELDQLLAAPKPAAIQAPRDRRAPLSSSRVAVRQRGGPARPQASPCAGRHRTGRRRSSPCRSSCRTVERSTRRIDATSLGVKSTGNDSLCIRISVIRRFYRRVKACRHCQIVHRGRVSPKHTRRVTDQLAGAIYRAGPDQRDPET